MIKRKLLHHGIKRTGTTGIVTSVLLSAQSLPVLAQDTEVNGFIENATYTRRDVGLSKFRNTVQIEMGKDFGKQNSFSNVSVHGTFRGTYDGVYDLNDDEYGDNAGGAINMENVVGSNTVPWGGGLVLPGGDFDSTNVNPNTGLRNLGSAIHTPDGGVDLGVPVRPCDVDSRGCIPGYMDADSDELASPEFNKHADFIRELYVDATLPMGQGQEWNFRVGKQQVVWGRSDLFRVLDVINPVDYSRNNIYDELEDIRIPQWIATAEYRFGPTDTFDDLNLQFVWNFDEFRPSNLGQGGTPNSILDAGSLFRALHNCWHNGCTVGNFANGTVATDFPQHVIGIRNANLPAHTLDNSQFGVKLEGVYQSVGFSLNALRYRSQLPSLRGGIPADNPFTAGVESDIFPYLIAFDIDFPEVTLVGGSLDFYVDSIKSVFRVEAAYTSGEEFANTLRPELYSESDVFRWVLGWDRNTFIPFLNKNRSFLISGQLFGQHILDHELEQSTLGPVGMPDWENNYIATLLFKGWWMNDRLSPQVIFAHDFKAEATTIAPSIDWLINDDFRVVLAANIKTGDGAQKFDDCRACNPFPPFTGAAHPDPNQPGSIGLGGFEPLGRFRSGPIGMAQAEDEIQLTVRYRF